MFYWIYDLSTPTLAFLFTVVFVGVTWFGAMFIRPFVRLLLRGQAGINELVGYILGCHGVFYGLLLGLLAVAAYQHLETVEEKVAQEAASLASLYRDVNSYPEPIRTELVGQLREYARYIIEDAWPEQRLGKVPQGGAPRLNVLQQTLVRFEPKTAGQEILHAQTLAQYGEMIQLARLRLHAVETGIPALMWYVVALGAAINIVLVWAFDMKLMGQVFLGGLLSFFVGTVICLVAAMDNPFRGEISVSPDAFVPVYERMLRETGTAAGARAGRDAGGTSPGATGRPPAPAPGTAEAAAAMLRDLVAPAAGPDAPAPAPIPAFAPER